jgi:apolipoprotein N-acyltransferase
LKRSALAFALLGGALTALSFPKFELSFLAWISLIPFLFALQGRKPGAAFAIGLAAGAAFYAILLYWIPDVPAHYGNMSKGFSLSVYLILILFLGLFWGLFAAVYAVANRSFPKRAWLLVPAVWVASEFVLGHVLTGFPWGLLGTSQYRDLPLIQIAAVTGVYGVSFALVLFQASFVHSIRHAVRGPFFAGLIVLSGLHLAGTLTIKDTPRGPDALTVGVIQGDVPPDLDGRTLTEPDLRDLLERHLELSRRARDQGAGLVLWPELSVPLCFSCPDQPYASLAEAVRRFVAESGISLVVGSAETAGPPEHPSEFNAAVCLNPDGSRSEYDKMHLVPFGEYVPYPGLFGFVDRLTSAVGGLTPGRRIVLHRYRGIPFGTPICYEIVFPGLVRRFTREGAALLGTITNDGWYGTSAALRQHFAQAVLRAVENRRFLLRAATTGISGIIDPYGRILARSEPETRAVLVGSIVPSTRLSFYARRGDLFAVLCLTIAVLSLILGVLKGRHERRHGRV